MKIKVWTGKGKSEIVILDKEANFCDIHKQLNEKYGLKGCLGYENV